MNRFQRLPICLALLLCFGVVGMLSAGTGCVGPNKLKRGLDRKLEAGYVAHPLRAQLLFPVTFLLNHVAGVSDLLFVNPFYWWGDVLDGRGTSFAEAIGEGSADADSEPGTGDGGAGT